MLVDPLFGIRLARRGGRTRLVIRLWHVADVDLGPPLGSRPLWSGIVTSEESRTEFGLVATARTTNDAATPLQAVDQAARRGGSSVDAQARNGTPVLLVW